MHINLCPSELCTGCGACTNACTQGCISMIEDAHGFAQPKIDEGCCIRCGNCASVCPVLHPPPSAQTTSRAFAARSMKGSYTRSSSGAIFPVLAEEVLRQGGVVFGAAWTFDFRRVCHQAAETIDQLTMLCGSKYLPSETTSTFADVRKRLLSGQKVYYSGTPCQIAGLLSFLNGRHPLLTTQSVICHGVPAPVVWRAFLDEDQQKNECVTNLNFRARFGRYSEEWVQIDYDSGLQRRIRKTDFPFFRGYLSNLYLREACYSCRFKGENDPADITLGDCWGVKRIAPSLCDGYSLSCVLLRTKHGTVLWDRVCNTLEYAVVSIEDLQKYNPMMCQSASKTEKSAFFWKRFSTEPMTALVASVCPKTAKERIQALVPPGIKQCIKKCFNCFGS